MTVGGGTTTLKLKSAPATALRTIGVSISATAPAKAASAQAFRFPITGGRLTGVTAGSTGSVRLRHSGGLRFSVAGQSLTATDFRLNLGRKVLTGVVQGRRVPLFSLETQAVKVRKGSGTVTISGISATLGRQFVKDLTQQLNAPTPPSVALGTLTSHVTNG